MLDEPRPGVEILVDGRVATVCEVHAERGALAIAFEYADGSRGDVVLTADEEDA